MWEIPSVSLDDLRQRAAGEPVLLDQHGRKRRFFADLLARGPVLINASYSACTDSCPPAMHHLMQARPLLGAQGKGLQFASITLTPLEDSPQVLRGWAERYSLPPDWTLLTGTPAAVEDLRKRLGLGGWSAEPLETGNHIAVARLCDHRRTRWTHVNLLLPPRSIARMIRYELA